MKLLKEKKWLSSLLFVIILAIGFLLGNGLSQSDPSDVDASQPVTLLSQTEASEAVTQAKKPTEAMTQATTEAATEATTGAATEATTEAATQAVTEAVTQPTTEIAGALAEDGHYTTKEEVALYLHLYGRLPSNFLKKKEAEKLGWESSKGNLGKVAPGMSIGGDTFGNYEGILPQKKGRRYYECDIDFDGGFRSAKRIVFSNDGLIYYTEDHYQTFELLYGNEE